MIKNKKGFSLVEMAIALGLIALLVGVVSAGGGMMGRTRVQRENKAVENLWLASQNYLSIRNLTYTGISVTALKTLNLLPSTFEPLAANSYGGDYSIGANPVDPTRVDISLANIPVSVAGDLSDSFKGKAESTSYDAGNKVWKGTF